MIPIQATMLFPYRNGRVLLGCRKTEPWKGVLFGPGGKKQKGETVLACAVREPKEELGLLANASDLRHIGIMRSRRPSWAMDVHLYRLEKWSGLAQSTDEMDPVWVTCAESDMLTIPKELRQIITRLSKTTVWTVVVDQLDHDEPPAIFSYAPVFFSIDFTA